MTVYIFKQIHICICICICIYACIYLCICIHICMYIYTSRYTYMIPVRATQTIMQKHVLTGARSTCTCYRMGDLTFQWSEGTEATFRLPLTGFGSFYMFDVDLSTNSLEKFHKLRKGGWVSGSSLDFHTPKPWIFI